MEDVFEQCRQAIVAGDRATASSLAEKVLSEGIDPLTAIEEGFVTGLREAGRLWDEGELFLPELVMAAEAMKDASAVLQPALLAGGQQQQTQGRVVIGTIEGDIHDIGKTLVATMLSANGFEIKDLGPDVPIDRFIEEAEVYGARFICISALLTTTMAGQRRVIEQLTKNNLRDKYRVLIGGAPCNEKWAAEIGADGYAGDAISAVKLAEKLLSAQ
jgi:trimethylamine corrinoid protein